LWNAETGKTVLSLKGHTASIYSVAFSSDGTRVASASWDHTVRVWDVSPNRSVRRWAATPENKAADEREIGVVKHNDRVNSVTLSHDNKLMVTASEDKTVRVWDTETGNEITSPHLHRAVVWSVIFTPDDLRLISASWEKDAWIHAWRIDSEKLTAGKK
jgi:WD40 repeat protein